MNKRSYRNENEKAYPGDSKENKTYWKNAISIIISILIVGGIAFYLKNVNNPTSQKVEANSEIRNETKDIKEDDKKEEIIVKEPVKKTILISFAGDFTLGTDTKFAYESSLPAAFINSGRKYSYFMQNVSSVFSQR